MAADERRNTMGKIMIGQQFGLLVVIGAAGNKPNGHHSVRAWRCVCACGRERIVAESELKRLRVTSCDKRRKVPRGTEYRSYWALKARCFNPTNADYRNYGGRGITVCARWLNGAGCQTAFECFLSDMGPRPSPEHSIDRIDNDGPYSPGNCRWASNHEQSMNRQNTIRIAVGTQKMTLGEAAQMAGIRPATLRDRIKRYGLLPDEALSRPLYGHRRKRA